MHVAEIGPGGCEVRRKPQRGLVVAGRRVETAALHMGIAEFGVQAGDLFTRRTRGAPAGSIAPELRGGDGFVDPAGRGQILPALEMLGSRRGEGLGGLDG
jgi:hypothetical protein